MSPKGDIWSCAQLLCSSSRVRKTSPVFAIPLFLVFACGDDRAGGASSEADTEGSGGTSTGTTSAGASTTDNPTTTMGGSGDASTADPSTSTTAEGTTTTTTTTGPDTGGDGAARCGDTPPDGAELAPEIPPFGGIGTCPVIETGYYDGFPGNVMKQSVEGKMLDRTFLVIVPDDIGPDERLPVIFMWHWLGGEAKAFYEKADTQNAVNEKRFIAVIPDGRDDLLFKWPFSALDSQAALEADFGLFDDMLACVNQQFNIDKDCVSSVGVSAGALFTDQLAGGRGQHLASILSLSGGTGGLIKPWTAPEHKMPAMVLWGGANDFCIAINFQDTSHDLEMHHQQGGHFVLECVHNCNHSTPPFPVPPGMTAFAPLWDFFLDHPYWLAPGDSPYLESGLPESMPDWCAIGVGNAVPPPEKCDLNECS